MSLENYEHQYCQSQRVGLEKIENQLQPITRDMNPAPELSAVIRCTCKTDTNEPCSSVITILVEIAKTVHWKKMI